VKQAEEVSYYNDSAKIYSAQDGYHATWYFNGKRIKRQFRTLKLAKEAALQALRQIHHKASLNLLVHGCLRLSSSSICSNRRIGAEAQIPGPNYSNAFTR